MKVYARATVDEVADDDGQNARYRVEVTGAFDHEGVVRVYEFNEESEGDAAMRGIAKFSEEMGGKALPSSPREWAAKHDHL